MTTCRIHERPEEGTMRSLFRVIQSLLLASLLLVGTAGTALAEDEATESQETPAVAASPPESASDAGEEEETSEAEQSGEAEDSEE
jgi:hypothetical protein